MTKFRLIVVGLLMLFLSSYSAIAMASTPKEQTCGLLNAILDGGVMKGNLQLAKMANWMAEPTKSQMSYALNHLQNYKFISASAFLIGELPSIFEEHLMAIEAENNIPTYLRLSYEKFDGEMKLVFLFIDSPFAKSRDRGAFLQSPDKISCNSLTR